MVTPSIESPAFSAFMVVVMSAASIITGILQSSCLQPDAGLRQNLVCGRVSECLSVSGHLVDGFISGQLFARSLELADGFNSQVHSGNGLRRSLATKAAVRAEFDTSAIANFLLTDADRERLDRTMSLIEFQSNWLANPRRVDMFVVPIPCSSMVERAAVNRQVTGSSPVGGVQAVGLSRGRPSCFWGHASRPSGACPTLTTHPSPAACSPASPMR